MVTATAHKGRGGAVRRGLLARAAWAKVGPKGERAGPAGTEGRGRGRARLSFGELGRREWEWVTRRCWALREKQGRTGQNQVRRGKIKNSFSILFSKPNSNVNQIKFEYSFKYTFQLK